MLLWCYNGCSGQILPKQSNIGHIPRSDINIGNTSTTDWHQPVLERETLWFTSVNYSQHWPTDKEPPWSTHYETEINMKYFSAVLGNNNPSEGRDQYQHKIPATLLPPKWWYKTLYKSLTSGTLIWQRYETQLNCLHQPEMSLIVSHHAASLFQSIFIRNSQRNNNIMEQAAELSLWLTKSKKSKYWCWAERGLDDDDALCEGVGIIHSLKNHFVNNR